MARWLQGMKLEVQSSRTGRDYTQDAVIHTWLADKLSQSGVFNIRFTLSKSITAEVFDKEYKNKNTTPDIINVESRGMD